MSEAGGPEARRPEAGYVSRRVARPPGVLPSYLRAVRRGRGAGRPGGPSGALPPVELVLPGLTVDRRRLARYARVCGGGPGEFLPPAYPHLLAFPAALTLMTAPGFPLPALGLVHTANTLTRLRPIRADERLTVRVRTADLRPHARGTVFDVLTEVSSDTGGDLVWHSSSSYLRRHPAEPGRPAAAPPPGPGAAASPFAEAARWQLPAGAGRRYASVSGDRNPIHLHPWTARLFGFRRAVAHGMWTKARVLEALGPELPVAVRVEVSFRAPVPLPSEVRLGLDRASDGRCTSFALTGAADGRTHLRGRADAL
ncbi:MaoC/PaaZ C-terminal domain-containing protein [Kitasatospora herbaricolor]|uniref:MaoC/PaaZ C-terminal domain-containing protein n=1 Tax=Kitasatospora herbaricolor TaxID=68217 RepID=UPI0036DF5A17